MTSRKLKTAVAIGLIALVLGSALIAALSMSGCSLFAERDEHIKTDPETGKTYIDNRLGFICYDGTEPADVKELAASVGGKIVERNGGGAYVIEIAVSGYEAILEKCRTLKANDLVQDAYAITPDYNSK